MDRAELIRQLREEAHRLSGRSLDRGCVDSGIEANLAGAAADALEAAPAVPDGWKLAPVEPTWQMCAAGGMKHDEMVREGDADPDEPDMAYLYPAMLEAAPEAPGQVFRRSDEDPASYQAALDEAERKHDGELPSSSPAAEPVAWQHRLTPVGQWIECTEAVFLRIKATGTDHAGSSAEARALYTAPPSARQEGFEVHPDDLAVDRFAAAMKLKLAKKRAEGRGGWEDKGQCSAEHLSDLLRSHVEKGDPLDVGNLAMMLHQRGERVSAPQPSSQEGNA